MFAVLINTKIFQLIKFIMTSQERYSGSRISGQSAYSSGTGFGQTGLSESFSGLNVRNVQASGATQPANFEAKRQELEGETEALLRYASELNKNVVVSGSTDYSKISTLKNALLELRNAYFSQSSGLSIQGENRDELDRRFLLVEHELDGLLRRRIEYSSKDYESGTRTLDFTNLLNEKENQIVEL